jgi:hypothetical protein
MKKTQQKKNYSPNIGMFGKKFPNGEISSDLAHRLRLLPLIVHSQISNQGDQIWRMFTLRSFLLQK